jgi:hypothetical protein
MVLSSWERVQGAILSANGHPAIGDFYLANRQVVYFPVQIAFPLVPADGKRG